VNKVDDATASVRPGDPGGPHLVTPGARSSAPWDGPPRTTRSAVATPSAHRPLQPRRGSTSAPPCRGPPARAGPAPSAAVRCRAFGGPLRRASIVRMHWEAECRVELVSDPVDGVEPDGWSAGRPARGGSQDHRSPTQHHEPAVAASTSPNETSRRWSRHPRRCPRRRRHRVAPCPPTIPPCTERRQRAPTDVRPTRTAGRHHCGSVLPSPGPFASGLRPRRAPHLGCR
jgi:hypothetical protein